MIRVLFVGCGDIALRSAALLRGRARLYGLTRRVEDVARLRARDITPVVADLDDWRSLSRIDVAPYAVLHFAPPPSEGRDDPRTRHLVAALSKARRIPQRFVYVSTSGVYGDCAGARIGESRKLRPQSPRAVRRVAAETCLRAFAAAQGVTLAILRVPGIYAESRLPLERIRNETPVLDAADDVHTNHIHADDLARACVAAMFRGSANRAYNTSDDAELKLGDWMDLVADAHGLARAPRVSWEEAEARIAPQLLSFMQESRRLVNKRLKDELRLRLRYPTPEAMLAIAAPRTVAAQIELAL